MDCNFQFSNMIVHDRSVLRGTLKYISPVFSFLLHLSEIHATYLVTAFLLRMLPLILKHSTVLYVIFFQLSLFNVSNVSIDAFTGFLQVEPATRQSFEALDVTYRRRSPNLSLRNSKCQSMLTSSPRNSQTNLAVPTPLSAAAFGFPPPPMVSP